jgi:hypothetical protein
MMMNNGNTIPIFDDDIVIISDDVSTVIYLSFFYFLRGKKSIWFFHTIMQ